MKRTMTALILLATTRLLTACGPASEQETLPAESDAMESQTQALYESCTDSTLSLVQPDGAAVAFQYPNCSYADSAATSVDGTYDQPLCANKFVTEVQAVNGLPFTPFVELVPASEVTTQSACEGVAITGYAWGYAGRLGWVSLGSVVTNGIWHPQSCGGLFCFPAYCQLRFDIGTGASGYSKVRVAGFGAALGIFKARVKTGVHAGPGPC
jgi:hypothetical protein